MIDMAIILIIGLVFLFINISWHIKIYNTKWELEIKERNLKQREDLIKEILEDAK